MGGVIRRHLRSGSAAVFAVAMAMVAMQAPGASQGLGRVGTDASLTYIRGQSVLAVFHGWMENPDGSFDLHFSYINQNWQEELDIPIGPDNNIQPAPFGPDGGQPTHFFPRVNRWQFAVRVPKDFGSKEVVWTLTSHGETSRAYASLNPGYQVDDFLIMHEFGSPLRLRGRKPPTLKVEGEKQRTVKVGQPISLIAVATEPAVLGTGTPGTGVSTLARRPNELRPGLVGGDFVRENAKGLYLAWFVYRGPSAGIKFDPPIPFKVWEDQRGGSPWSPGWQPPPIPPGNKWVHNVTFRDPGRYVLRAQARDEFNFANEDITFTVTP